MITQNTIVEFLSKAVPQMRSSEDAENCLMKLASEQGFSPAVFERACHIFNELKVNSLYDNSPMEKRGSFTSTLDVPAMLEEYTDFTKDKDFLKTPIPNDKSYNIIVDNADFSLAVKTASASQEGDISQLFKVKNPADEPSLEEIFKLPNSEFKYATLKDKEICSTRLRDIQENNRVSTDICNEACMHLMMQKEHMEDKFASEYKLARPSIPEFKKLSSDAVYFGENDFHKASVMEACEELHARLENRGGSLSEDMRKSANACCTQDDVDALKPHLIDNDAYINDVHKYASILLNLKYAFDLKSKLAAEKDKSGKKDDKSEDKSSKSDDDEDKKDNDNGNYKNWEGALFFNDDDTGDNAKIPFSTPVPGEPYVYLNPGSGVPPVVRFPSKEDPYTFKSVVLDDPEHPENIDSDVKDLFSGKINQTPWQTRKDFDELVSEGKAQYTNEDRTSGIITDSEVAKNKYKGKVDTRDVHGNGSKYKSEDLIDILPNTPQYEGSKDVKNIGDILGSIVDSGYKNFNNSLNAVNDRIARESASAKSDNGDVLKKEMLDVDANGKLNELLYTDPVLSKLKGDKLQNVLEAYASIVNIYPNLIHDTAALRSFLRSSASVGGGVDLASIEMLSKIRKNMTNDKVEPSQAKPSTSVGDK